MLQPAQKAWNVPTTDAILFTDAVVDCRRELCAFSRTHKPGFKASSCPEH